MNATTDDRTRRASLAANRAAKRAKVTASRAAAVADLFAAYAEPADVPASVWDAAVAWSATAGGYCYADAFADVADVCPDGWDRTALADLFADAADRYADQ